MASPPAQYCHAVAEPIDGSSDTLSSGLLMSELLLHLQ